MTPRLRGHSPRRALHCALAAAGFSLACEARVAGPVSPVADVAVRDGRASPVRITPQNTDSIRASLTDGLRGRFPAPGAGDDRSKPLLVVYDAAGAVVHVGRLTQGPEGVLSKVAAEGIQSVEVFKGGAVLPPEAPGGMIVVRLKAGVEFKAPS